jgi:hypothetical protein
MLLRSLKRLQRRPDNKYSIVILLMWRNLKCQRSDETIRVFIFFLRTHDTVTVATVGTNNNSHLAGRVNGQMVEKKEKFLLKEERTKYTCYVFILN